MRRRRNVYQSTPWQSVGNTLSMITIKRIWSRRRRRAYHWHCRIKGGLAKDKLDKMTTYVMPKNLAASSKWALKNLKDWHSDYKSRYPDMCPQEILTPYCSKENLNKWLSTFAVETRNHQGKPYPPKTIYSLLCGILREMRNTNPHYPNFLNKEDSEFSTFHTTLDNLFKSLRNDGFGSSSLGTEGISSEEEDMLCKSGVINLKTPKGLPRAAFYICGKCFCLRGGSEHRNLTLSHFQRLDKPDRYVYQERVSKNKPGGFKQLQMEHKVVSIVANQSAGDRCPVFVLDLYISKLPDKAKCIVHHFLRYPKILMILGLHLLQLAKILWQTWSKRCVRKLG